MFPVLYLYERTATMRKKSERKASLIGERVDMSFTAVFLKEPERYVGFVEELPGANTQGATLREVRKNLKEAIRLVLQANKRISANDISRKHVIREKIEVSLR
jgi:predicted RNase H-like HicB family nuclease